MKRAIYILIAAILCIGAASCMKEDLHEKADIPEGESWLMMDFGALRNDEVITKSTVGEVDEGQIYNFYLFVFDANGAKVTGEFFDTSNQKASLSAVENSFNNCWYVSNATKTGEQSNGTVRLKTANGSGMKIYMIVNLDADMVRISSDLLAHNIQKESDLTDFNVYLNQRIINRNGYFPMTGKISGIEIGKRADEKDVVITYLNKKMSLKRIDAKIRFIFKTGSRKDASQNGQTIKSFTAKQWKVMNVPRTAYLFGYADREISAENGYDFISVDPDTLSVPISEYSAYAKDFFDTSFENFEDFPNSTQSEFSFYMLENRQKCAKTPGTFQDRSRSLKSTAGLNRSCEVSYVINGVSESRDMRLFEYANPFSTYVVVTGRVEMDLENDTAGQVLGGDVQYIIHLGHWNSVIDPDGRGDTNDKYSGFDNFNTERNTSYSYTVTVNSVNSIRVEVETSNNPDKAAEEQQPGASGDITIAKEKILICDSHYMSKTISFNLSNFFENGDVEHGQSLADELTWSVRTPFADGEPKRIEGVDITHDLDYKWIHFRINKKNADGVFSEKRRKYTSREFKKSDEWKTAQDNVEGDGTEGLAGYHNDGIMDITQLVTYIRDEVKAYQAGKANEFDKNSQLSFTAFVDEFYYEANPITGERSADLWKHFVNQEDRQMHILCSTEVSNDKESRITGSVITIQQHAIQCVYNTDPSYTALSTAWGSEYTDEYDGKMYYWKEVPTTNYAIRFDDGTNPLISEEKRGNDSDSNGLFNTCKEWGLSPAGNSKTFNDGLRWSTFMDYEVDNDTPDLKDEYAYLRYSCMSRNRDNNGNGKIDRDEVRWYMASIRQLIGLYVGNGLLPRQTKIYNKSPEDKGSSDNLVWQQHVFSSTSDQDNRWSNNPNMVWSEEGISTSQIYPKTWKQDIWKGTVRCVRNLGYIDGNSTETYDISMEPEDYITMERQENGNIIFTNTHLNSQALRYYTSRELPFADQNSTENRLYKKFEVYKTVLPIEGLSRYKFADYNNAINESIAQGNGNPYCPEGYRTPNQLEIALFRWYLGEASWQTSVSRTYWSMGPLGNEYDPAKKDNLKKVGFIKNSSNNITVNDTDIKYVRCVRDIRVN